MVESGYRMPSPPGCPPELYEIMLECWKSTPLDRPTFETLQWKLEEFFVNTGDQYREPSNIIWSFPLEVASFICDVVVVGWMNIRYKSFFKVKVNLFKLLRTDNDEWFLNCVYEITKSVFTSRSREATILVERLSPLFLLALLWHHHHIGLKAVVQSVLGWPKFLNPVRRPKELALTTHTHAQFHCWTSTMVATVRGLFLSK